MDIDTSALREGETIKYTSGLIKRSNKVAVKTVDYYNNIKDIMDQDKFMDNFIYLTNRKRGKTTTREKLLGAYYSRTFGTMIRKLDPSLFYQG